jgi:predicted phosphodiesterase
VRLAVLSDIHGNQVALEAVLADLEQNGGADRIWILGDLIMSGPRPAECIRIIRDLQTNRKDAVEVIGGNTDRHLVNRGRRGSPAKDAEAWAGLPDKVRASAELFYWTHPRIVWEDAEFLIKILHRELELEVPGYGWVIGFHGGPGNDEFLMWPDMPDDQLLDALSDREGRLALGGHTHHVMDRDLGAWRVVNVGSVGLPNDETRAQYTVITFEGDQAQADQRLVAFDSEAVIHDMEDQQHPEAAWVANLLRTGKADLNV